MVVVMTVTVVVAAVMGDGDSGCDSDDSDASGDDGDDVGDDGGSFHLLTTSRSRSKWFPV